MSELEKLVQEAAVKLSEHCDTVRIFITKHDGSTGDVETSAYSTGVGNFYAQLGQIQEWIQRQEESVRIDQRKLHSGAD